MPASRTFYGNAAGQRGAQVRVSRSPRPVKILAGVPSTGRPRSAEGAQGQRHLRLEGERRVTAGEDQLQPLVRDGGVVVHEGLRWLWPGLEVAGEQRRLRGQDLLAAQLVDGAVTRGRDQPAGGVGRFPVAWPAFGGDGERLGGRVFGQLDVAQDADQCCQQA